MIDLRPVAHPIGKILIVLGAGMTLPMALDWWDGNPNWTIFLQCSLLTMVGDDAPSPLADGCSTPYDDDDPVGISMRELEPDAEKARWLRPKASAGPPVIPPEVLEWAKAPPKTPMALGIG